MITLQSGDGTKINIANLKDLQMLPDKSIKVLFHNKNYIETIYLYVLYKLDMYLDHHNYAWEIRAMYFNDCFRIIPKLKKHQEDFLSGKGFCSDRAFDAVPKEIIDVHKKCIDDVCNFFGGILSTTPYLNKKIFPNKKLLLMKHNYVNMFRLLRNL